MRRRDLIHLVPFALVAASATGAFANEDAPKKGSSGQFVDLSPVALPVVVDGRLINYVFVALRLNLTPGADAAKLREKEPFFRDALVRAGHRTPFTDYRDYTRLDEPKMKAALMREAAAITGPGKIASISYLSPPTPQRRTGLPRPKVK